jgi:hypothetical protein
MRIIESDQISSTLKVFQDFNFIHSETALGTTCAHIAENGRMLTVHVPKNAKAQDICYLSRLPKAFAEWLKPPYDAEEEVIRLLTLVFATDKDILDDVLDDQGIMNLSFAEKDAGEIENSDGEEESYDIEVLKRSKDHTSDLHNDRKDTRKVAFTEQGVFNFHGLQSTISNIENAEKALPGDEGWFANFLKSQK